MRSAVNFIVRILRVLFTQVSNKHLRMNDSINLEFLTEMPQHFGRAKCWHKKKKDVCINWQFKNIIFWQNYKNHQDWGRYGPKTINRHTFPWYESWKNKKKEAVYLSFSRTKIPSWLWSLDLVLSRLVNFVTKFQCIFIWTCFELEKNKKKVEDA